MSVRAELVRRVMREADAMVATDATDVERACAGAPEVDEADEEEEEMERDEKGCAEPGPRCQCAVMNV